MKKIGYIVLSLLLCAGWLNGQDYEQLPADPYFKDFKAVKAPAPGSLLLQKGDNLAIIGDSITEQKMYSRIMETYLTVCMPQLEITCRQLGWSGERADGFRNRMGNDCLRFKPTIATTCYGMNDHRYESYKVEYGNEYYENSTAIAKVFKDAGIRFVQGSPGIVGLRPSWQNNQEYTAEMMNLSLCEFRNIGIKIAQEQNVAFADVFIPMLVAGFQAKSMYNNPDYQLAGADGVHPDWAGHLVMAYAFLKALGLDGEIGTFTFDLANAQAQVSDGHKILSCTADQLEIQSSRYPFCASGDSSSYKTIRSGMSLVPFNDQFNRMILIVKNGTAEKYTVTWGTDSREYTKEQLEKGVNLAADFETNPFSAAFKAVDDAVARKQDYETRQVKNLIHGDEGKLDMETTVSLTERVREKNMERIRNSFQPVNHTITIKAQ